MWMKSIENIKCFHLGNENNVTFLLEAIYKYYL